MNRDLLHRVRVADLETLTSDRDVVVLRAVNQEVVRAATSAVDGEGAHTLTTTISGNAWQCQGQRDRVATDVGQFGDAARLDIAAAHGRFRLEQRTSLRRHVHRDLLTARSERSVDFLSLAALDGDVVLTTSPSRWRKT